MAEPLYVVTGATGHTGSIVTQTLLEQRKRVRVIGRAGDRLKAFTDRGAEAAVGSLEDAGFVRRAFQGATALYAMIPPNNQTADFRAFQDQLVENIGQAAEAAGVTQVVTLSSLGAELSQGTGPVVGLHRLEERLARLPSVLNLRAAYFLENHLFYIPMIKQVGLIGGATKPDVPVEQIAVRDVGAVAAGRLAALDFKGHSVLDVLGPGPVSMRQVAKTLGAAIGKPDLEYVHFPDDEAKKGMVAMGVPEKTAALYVEMSRALSEQRMKPTQPPAATVRTKTTLEDFARGFAGAFQAA